MITYLLLLNKAYSNHTTEKTLEHSVKKNAHNNTQSSPRAVIPSAKK